MRDFLKDIPLIVILFVVVSVVRAIMAALKGKPGAEAAADGDESEEQRRVREIQERIRRIAAERRGQRPPGLPPPLAPAARPVPQTFERPVMAPTDPFGGPVRPILTKFERRPPRALPPPEVAYTRSAELVRQEQLQEDLRVLDEKKLFAARHKAQDAAALEQVAQSEAGLRGTARERLLEDVRDPAGLRRAFVLREVLGTPVGLR